MMVDDRMNAYNLFKERKAGSVITKKRIIIDALEVSIEICRSREVPNELNKEIFLLTCVVKHERLLHFLIVTMVITSVGNYCRDVINFIVVRRQTDPFYFNAMDAIFNSFVYKAVTRFKGRINEENTLKEGVILYKSEIKFRQFSERPLPIRFYCLTFSRFQSKRK